MGDNQKFRNILSLLLGVVLMWTFDRAPSYSEKDVAPSAGARAILYVHFHKSGGSTVCELMRRSTALQMTDMNDLGLRPDKLNCNTEISGPNHDAVKYHALQTCRMLETYTMDGEGRPFRRLNFLSVEVPFVDAMPCPGFRSFALMRDPVQRILSNMVFEHFAKSTVLDWVEVGKRKQKKDKYIFGYPLVNSFVIRQLLGRDRYQDLRPINAADFEKAKDLVDRFDAFVPLEHLRNENVLKLLNSTVKEFYDVLMQNNRLRVNHDNTTTPPAFFQDEDFLELLRRENKYDIQLYQYILDKLGIYNLSGT